MGKPVIIGASGFVGQAVTHLFNKRGTKHVAHSSSSLNLLGNDAVPDIARTIENNDTIILLSALTPEKGEARETTVQNIQMVRNILAGVKDKNISQFIYVSSDAVYPLNADMIDETTPTVSDRLYGFAHIVREQMLREALPEDKLTILRPCAIYGNNDDHNAYGVMRFIRSAIHDKEITLFGGGEEYRDHLFVDDLALIIHYAYQHKTAGTYNVASGKSWRFIDLANYINECLGGDIKIINKPRSVPIQHRHVNMCKTWSSFPHAKPHPIEAGVKQVIGQLV